MTRGLLQEIRLTEIIQLMGISERTGVLDVTPLYPRRRRPVHMPLGQIAFREGLPIAARLADRHGTAALENLFLWEAGFFAFRALDVADLPEQNLTIESDILVLQGVKRQEQWNEARALVPTMRAVLHRAAPRPGQTLPHPATPEGQLLAVCDGWTQLDAQAQQLGWGRLRGREVAAHLLAGGLVAYGPLSVGERLVQALVLQSLPTLGVAADLFCNDALLMVHIAPEHLSHVTFIAIPTVQAVIGDIERSVAETLDPMRAEALARHLCHALHVSYEPPAEVQHV